MANSPFRVQVEGLLVDLRLLDIFNTEPVTSTISNFKSQRLFWRSTHIKQIEGLDESTARSTRTLHIQYSLGVVPLLTIQVNLQGGDSAWLI